MTTDATCQNPACIRPGTSPRPTYLKTIEYNYSGTGVDIAGCPSCKREYVISYKVDKVVRIDPNTMEPIV